MDNFYYYAPTQYVFGTDALERLGEMAARHLGDTIMIVLGQGSARRSGLLAEVRRRLEPHGPVVIELEGVQPNPLDDKVREGIALARERGVTGLLAVGGGSVIDTAKAIAAGVPYEGDFWDFWAGRATVQQALPVGVVLTIPAAGSEGSGNSVITLRDGMRKISLRTDHWLRPRFALLDPRLTYTLPPYQTACGVADMMAHIMERYFSPTQDVEVTDRIAEGLLKAIIEEAPKVMADPTGYQARANIMWAGTLAHNGVAGCGRREEWVSHFLEHELSALYGVAHGAGLAVVFPAWLTYCADRRPAKIAQWARRVWDVTPTADERADALEGIARMRAFFAALGLPTTLPALGIDHPDIARLTASLHDNKGATIGSFMPLTAADTPEVYKLMM